MFTSLYIKLFFTRRAMIQKREKRAGFYVILLNSALLEFCTGCIYSNVRNK